MQRFQLGNWGSYKKSSAVFRSRDSLFERIRDFFWSYPEKFIPSFEKILQKGKGSYEKSRPLGPIFFVLALMFLVVVGVYYSATQIKTGKKDTLTEGILGMADNFNPIFLPEYQVQKDVYQLVFDQLFTVLTDGSVEGELVEKWEYKNNGTELYLLLRPDIYWQDGVSFTSSDVKFTIELFKQLQGQESYYDTVSDVDVEIISGLELTIKKERASGSFLETITWPVLPKHLLENISISDLEDCEFAQNPIGTGAFKFFKWSPNQLTLERNENYWKGNASLKNIIFKSYSSEKMLISAIEAGKIDATTEITAINVDSLKQIPWIEIDSAPLYRRYWAIYLNFNGPDIFDDERTRQALSSAVNRNRIIEEALNGYAVEAPGPIYPLSWAYNADVTRYDYNVETAKKLLGEVGYKIPEGEIYYKKEDKVLEFELAYVSNPIQEKVVKLIQEDFLAIGVKVNLTSMSYQEFRDTRLLSRNFDAILFGVESLLDPDHYILWHSSQATAPGKNFSSYKSSYVVLEDINRVDDVLEKGKASLDQTKRAELYKKLQSYILDETPAIFIYYPSFIYTHNERIKGVQTQNVTLPEERFNSVLQWKIE